jgi:hypothetical protein
VRYNFQELRRSLDDAVVNNVTNWRLSSSGDASSAGGAQHVDFISGWPEDLFQQILDNCAHGGKAINSTVTCPIERYIEPLAQGALSIT